MLNFKGYLIFKVTLGKFLIGTAFIFCSNISIAQAGLFAKSCNNNRKNPAASIAPVIRQIKAIGDNVPLCKDEFVTRIGWEMQNYPAERTRLRAIMKAVQLAEQSVRTLQCPHGTLQATFISQKTFLTNAHAFHEPILKDGYQRSGDKVSMDGCEILNGERSVPMNLSLVPLVGNPEKVSTDVAAASVTFPLGGIAPVPIFDSANAKKPKSDFVVASRMRLDPLRPELASCLSFVRCKSERVFWNKDSESSIHKTDCAVDPGSSGGPVFTIAKNDDGSYNVGLSGITSGGKVDLADRSAYNTDNMFGRSIAIDGLMRNQAEEMLKQTGEGSLATIQSKIKQSASLVLPGQSL